MTIKAVLAVAVMTPFYFIGFDVIPQAAEEIKVPLKKIGSILILSVVCAVLFYALVIVAVGLVLTGPEILASENGTGLVTADAMAKAMNSATMAKVIIIGGMCGIITSWNSFLMGGSRALYSMAESYMVPKFFAKLHPQYKTPVNALYVIPNSGATLVWQEWLMAGGWAVLGVIFGVACKRKYRERFGLLVDIISNEDAVALQSSDEEISVALDRAIDDAIDKILAERNLTPAP